jgi:hypothetical protein
VRQGEEAISFYASVFKNSLAAREHKFVFNEAISFIVPCDTQQEIDYYWGKLSADPKAVRTRELSPFHKTGDPVSTLYGDLHRNVRLMTPGGAFFTDRDRRSCCADPALCRRRRTHRLAALEPTGSDASKA